jgi:hypothetical protein
MMKGPNERNDAKAATPGRDGQSTQVESNDLSNVFKESSLSPQEGGVLDNNRMAADNDNARKAIESSTSNAVIEKHREFPFPACGGSISSKVANCASR